MSSRSSGYSNAAYCNMYDRDDDDPDDDDGFSPYRCAETYVDGPADEAGREAPLGASGSLRFCESRPSTPASSTAGAGKTHRRRQRSFSAPRHHGHDHNRYRDVTPTRGAANAVNAVNVLAPMIAQARCNRETTPIRRSKSAVFAKESESCHAELLGQRGAPWRRTCQGYRTGVVVTPRYEEPPETPRYAELPEPLRYSEPPPVPGRNLAIIPPSTRPLLPPSPVRTSPKKSSWASPPPPRTARSPANTLALSGLFLLFTSAINCLLCFYLLAKKGRHYYIDFAVISGFAMLLLGFVGVRMGRRWEWALNRNYLAGYMVLSMLDVLLCGVLGLLASDWRPPDLPEVVEIASGAVCGLSTLMLLLALCLGASSCCKTPPPDNRVSHSVPSFIV